jgi:AmiR/NasT family two-component response regulator
MERGDASSGRPPALIVRVEVAVGMLMELRGWDSSTARAHLIAAAGRADTPVEKVATALLVLYDEPR